MSLPQTGVELIVKGEKSFFSTLNKAGGAVAGFGKTAAKAAIAGTAAVAAFGAAVGVASIKAAVDFESAFAGVIKTTDGLVDEFGNVNEAGEEMQQGFRDLAKEVPTAVEELLAIGELGGQLGIAKDGLVDFTRTIAAMGEATNLTTEEAASGFAQLANIMGTPQEEIENMGSSIVALGNNFATTERDILSFGQRIAGAGQIVGLTESQVFAIGAAFSSVGVQAEAGGTAVQKVLLGMNEAVLSGGGQLEIFAATAGMTADQFAQAFEKDAGLAFQDFVEGLGASGDDALTILDALELKDQRLTRAFLSLAGAGELLGETLDVSGRAFRENTALTTEAEARYRTTAAQFSIFKNTIKDVGITIGQALLPFVNQLLQQAQPLINELGQRLPAFLEGSLIPAIQNVAQWLGQNLPVAIAFVSEAWTNVLQPAIVAVSEFLTGTFIPLLGEIFDWLAVNVPPAIEFLAELWTGTLLPAAQTLADFWRGTLLPAIQSAKPVFEEVVSFITGVINGLVAWFQATLPLMQQTVAAVLTGISNFWQAHGAQIMALVTTIWETVKTIVTNAVNIVQNIIELVMNIISGNWEAVWENIRSILESVWNIMVAQVTLAIEQAKTIITFVLDAIKSLWEADWTDIENVLKNAWDDIKKTINDGIKAARDIIQFILDSVVTLIRDNWDTIVGVFDTGIEAAKGLLNAAVGAFQNAGRAIVDAIRSGIESAWSGLVGWFDDKLNDLKNKLPFSEPKDASSPLFGLSKAGRAIAQNIQDGLSVGMDGMVASFTDDLKRIEGAIGDVAETPAFVTGGGGIIARDNQSSMREFWDMFKPITEQVRKAESVMGSQTSDQASAAPFAAGPSMAGPIANNITFNTSVSNGMQAGQFEQRVLRTVKRGLQQ